MTKTGDPDFRGVNIGTYIRPLPPGVRRPAKVRGTFHRPHAVQLPEPLPVEPEPEPEEPTDE